MDIVYNAQNVPRVCFTTNEVNELGTKEFRLTLTDHQRGKVIDFTLTPYADTRTGLDTSKRIVRTSEDHYKLNLDSDIQTLRTQKVLPLTLYDGFRLFLTA